MRGEGDIIITSTVNEQARWKALGVFTTIYLLAGFLGMSIAPLAPFIQDDLCLSKAELGLFISALYLGSIITGYVAGWLSDRWSIYKTLILGLLLEAVLIGALWVVYLFPWMLVLYLVAGFGYGTINPATSKGVIFWFPPERRATAMAIKQTGFTVGSMLASMALPFVAVLTSWRWSILAAAVLTLFCGMICILFYPASAEPTRTVASSSNIRHQSGKNTWTGEVVLWSAICVFYAAVQGAGTAYLAVYMVKQFFYSAVAAGVFLALAQGGGALGRIVWGWVSDRWFTNKRKKELVVIGFIAAAATILFGLIPPNTPHFIIGILAAIFGFTAIGYNAIFLTVIGEIAGREKAGQATGLAITIGYLGIIAGPPVFGLIADKTGNFSLPWIIYGAALTLATCVAMVYAKKKPVAEKTGAAGNFT